MNMVDTGGGVDSSTMLKSQFAAMASGIVGRPINSALRSGRFALYDRPKPTSAK